MSLLAPHRRLITLGKGGGFYPGIPVAFDFVQGLYRLGSSAAVTADLATVATFSRPSVGTAPTGANRVTTFPADVPRRTDLGLTYEPPSVNQAPFGTAVAGAAWAFNGGGTAIGTPAPAAATRGSSLAMPDGLNSDAGKGITCTGLANDAARSRFVVGNDGRNKDGNFDGTPNTGNGIWTQSLVFLDYAWTKTGEVALQWPGDATATNRGVQGVTIDTVQDLIACCVPSLPIIAFFAPTTGAYVSKIDLQAPITGPNGLAYDGLRDIFWVTDNPTGTIYGVTRAGAVARDGGGRQLLYRPSGVEAPGLDQLHHHAATDELWFTQGANAANGAIYAVDPVRLRVVRAMTVAECKAIEGVTVHAGNVYVASDGYFHSVPPGNVAAPDNVNVVNIYPYAAMAPYRYSRIWAGYLDENGDSWTRLILDKGAGATGADFQAYIATGVASGSTATKTFAVDVRCTNSGESFTVYVRGDTQITQPVVASTTPARIGVSGAMVSAPTIQVGLRKGGAPYNTSDFADIMVRYAQLEVAASASSRIPNAGAAAANRAADALSIALPPGTYTLTATFDDNATQTFPAQSGTFPLPTPLNRSRIKTLTGVPA